MDINKVYKNWCKKADESLQEELSSLNEKDIFEAFSTSLQFGTAGLRGFLRAGTNGMNIHTVAQATQGFASYLKKNFKNPSVAIARDSRNKGLDFVKVCVGVLTANGVTCYYSEDVESTPGLSFSVRFLHCSAGICITASHNPAAYNGYKAYGPDGCQISSEVANEISEEISKIDPFEDVKFLDYKDAKDTEFAKIIGPEVRQAFLDACCDCSIVADKKEAENQAGELCVVYSALHGTGYPEVMDVLGRNGFTNIIPVKEQAEPNGNFPTCSYPNPETNEALKLGLDYCKDNNADLLIATDPDADRVGAVVRHNNDYVRLSGNEVGILLFNYLCESQKAIGKDLSNSVVVSTIVSTDLINDIANDYGIEIRRTLTGFKYIGGQILNLEKNDEEERYLFGFEESCGYLPGTHVRDKDGISSCLVFCQMCAYYKANGKDCIDVLNDLYKKYGYYSNDQISLEYPGVEGEQKIAQILSNIRKNKLEECCGLKVIKSKDYLEDTKMLVIGKGNNFPDELLPKSNVLEFSLENNIKFIVRPSGTEPKIKVYLFSRADTKQESLDMLDKLKKFTKELLS